MEVALQVGVRRFVCATFSLACSSESKQQTLLRMMTNRQSHWARVRVQEAGAVPCTRAGWSAPQLLSSVRRVPLRNRRPSVLSTPPWVWYCQGCWLVLCVYERRRKGGS